MFYITTFLFICCFATVLALTEFGCEFPGRGYAVPKPGEGKVWSEAVWGKEPPPLLVGTEAELKLFQAKIQEARVKVFKTNLFDQAEPLLTMIDNMPDNTKKTHQGKEFEKWWADYQPMVWGRQDELGIMMLILNQLSEDCRGTKWVDVKNSSFFAAVRTHVEYKEPKRLDAEETAQAPKEKDINELMGVVKVIVESTPGYILIDLDYYMEGALFINNPWPPITQFATVKSPFSMEDKHVTINVLGQDKAFIHLLTDSNDVTSDPSRIPTPPSSKVIYVQQPLCSILRTANVMMQYNPLITYGKLNAKGDMLAYVLTRYPDAKDFDSPFCKNMSPKDTFCAGYLTTDESTGKKQLVERTLSSVQNMSPDEEKFLKTVVGKMICITETPVCEELMEKLSKLDTYMIEYKKEKSKNKVEALASASWNSAKLQAAKIKDKLPSWSGLGKFKAGTKKKYNTCQASQELPDKDRGSSTSSGTSDTYTDGGLLDQLQADRKPATSNKVSGGSWLDQLQADPKPATSNKVPAGSWLDQLQADPKPATSNKVSGGSWLDQLQADPKPATSNKVPAGSWLGKLLADPKTENNNKMP